MLKRVPVVELATSDATLIDNVALSPLTAVGCDQVIVTPFRTAVACIGSNALPPPPPRRPLATSVSGLGSVSELKTSTSTFVVWPFFARIYPSYVGAPPTDLPGATVCGAAP